MVFSSGYDMSDKYKFGDTLGQIYTVIAGIWTIVLIIGASILVYNRNLPFLRIRNVPLLVSAVATLHVYWVLCMIAYGLNGHWPCLTEFWIMNIYLPLGIALFHAGNAQLLFIAKAQQKYTSHDYLPLIEQDKRQNGNNSWRKRLLISTKHRGVDKTMRLIALGMIVQVIVSATVFFLSKRFVPKFGVFGDDISGMPLEESRKVCRHGFEWLPSILWQFFWAWIYAPYVLWNVRHIHDVHGWRIQTICCCLIGLPASPMWLLALYLPQMSAVNRYFIPPLWFVPSIFLMEFFMIFAPCWQIVKNRKLKKETLEILAEWERQKNSTSLDSGSTKVGTISTASNKVSIASSATLKKAQPHLYTMTALEKALDTNATPLLMFAALKDFSGENVSFLIAVRGWKQAWNVSKRSSLLRVGAAAVSTDPVLWRQQYHRAIEIYASYISLKVSDYPINISSIHLKKLIAAFEESTAKLTNHHNDHRNAAVPFADYDAMNHVGIELAPQNDLKSTTSSVFDDTITGNAAKVSDHHQASIIETYRTRPLHEQLPEDTQIPLQFGPNVFNEAVDSIKYTVLTNTWPKFVNAGYAASIGHVSPFERLHEQFTEYRTEVAKLFS